MKILIVYYSKTGKTKAIAHTIANELADGNEVKLRRVRMKDERNLLATYLVDTKKAIRREKPEIEVIGPAPLEVSRRRPTPTEGLRPAGRRLPPDVSSGGHLMGFDHKEYDLILVGTPVWANNPAPAVNTYLDRSDFRDKKVALFVTLRLLGGEKVIEILTEEIEKKGGKVTDSIIIKTGLLHKKRMLQEAKAFTKKLSV